MSSFSGEVPAGPAQDSPPGSPQQGGVELEAWLYAVGLKEIVEILCKYMGRI